MVCVCSVRHPLAKRADVTLETLKSERLVLLAPPKSSFSMVQLQGHLMGERPPSEFYFCESTEAITVLVTAGYGISVLPDFLVPEMPLISRVPLTDVSPVSFGIYYKSLQNTPLLKHFIQCARESLAP